MKFILVLAAFIFLCQAEDIQQKPENPPVKIPKSFRKALLEALEQLERDEKENGKDNDFDEDDLEASDYDEDARSKFGFKIRESLSKQEGIVSGDSGNVFVHSFTENSDDSSKNKTLESPTKSTPDNAISASITSTVSGRKNHFSLNKKAVTAPVTPETSPTSPKPTVSTPQEEEDVTKVKVEDVQFIHAPLVAAFTVEQDDKGLPHKVIPIYGNKQIAQTTHSLQTSLEEKQQQIEQQIRILQEQKRQQEYLIQQHRFGINSFSQTLQNQNNLSAQQNNKFNSQITQQQSFVNNKNIQQHFVNNNKEFQGQSFVNTNRDIQGQNFVNNRENQGQNFVNTNRDIKGQNFVNNKENQGQNFVNNNRDIQGQNFVNNKDFQGQNFVNNREVQGQNFVKNNNEIQGLNFVNNKQIQGHNFVNNKLNEVDNLAARNRFNIPIPIINEASTFSPRPTKDLSNTLVSFQSSISYQPNGFLNQNFPQKLPVKEAIHFEKAINIPVQQNDNSLTHQQIPNQYRNQIFNNNNLQEFLYRQRTLIPPPPRGNRIFRQESDTGNFGLNQQQHRFSQPANFNFNNVPNNRYNSFNGFSSNNVNSRLNNLLYQSGLGQGRSQEDLNIVSKVLALDHTGNYNQNFLHHSNIPFNINRPFTTK